MCVLSHFSCVQFSATPWTIACQAPPSMGFPRQVLEWASVPSSRGSCQPRDQTHVSNVSCIGRWVLYHQHHLGSLFYYVIGINYQSVVVMTFLLHIPEIFSGVPQYRKLEIFDYLVMIKAQKHCIHVNSSKKI